MRKVIFLIFCIFLLSFISASVVCKPNTLSSTYFEGNTIKLSTSCTNDGNSTTISYSGDTNYFNISDTAFSLGSKTIFIHLFSIAPPGFHTGSLDFGTGYSVPISFYVEEIEVEQGAILVFPTSKIVTVQQGSEKTQTIQVTVPESYPNIVTIQSVDMNPSVETILFGDINLGQVAPGQSIQIPLTFTGKDAQTGTYTTSLNIFATDSEGQVNIPTISLQLQVTSGVSPDLGDVFSTRPSCALSGNTFNLNQTATLSCSGVVQNLEVNPQYDEHIEGKSVDLSSGIYTYTFKPIKYGVLDFLATFTYRGTPIFEAFSSQIKINPSGTNLAGGTDLKAEFYQGGDKKDISELEEGELRVLVLDNITDSVIDMDEVNLYLNGDEVNNTFDIELDRDYELRVSALNLGYVDLILEINVTQTPIEISLAPDKPFYHVGDIVTINTIPNSSILINNVVSSNTHTFVSEGNVTIKAVNKSHQSTIKYVEVKPSIIILTSTPDKLEDWKKGKDVIARLSENITWKVIRDGSEIASGTGNEVEFKIEEAGGYHIKSGDYVIRSFVVEDKGVWNWVKDNWLWVVVGVVIVILLVVIFQDREGKSEKSFGGFEGQTFLGG